MKQTIPTRLPNTPRYFGSPAEYRCRICGVSHRSDEDSYIFHAHLSWNPKAIIRPLPERYYESDRSFRFLSDQSYL